MNPLTSGEVAELAAREAAAGALGSFTGGDAGGLIILIILIAGIYALLHLGHHH